MRIKLNAAKCAHCGTVIVSTHRHDFRSHECVAAGLIDVRWNHDKRAEEPCYPWFAVDGGHDYVRRCGNPGMFIDLVEYEE